MKLVLRSRYLTFPVRTGAPMRRLRVTIEDGPVREFDIELDGEQTEFWTFLDVSAHPGKGAVLELVGGDPDEHLLAYVSQYDDLPGGKNLYREELRPQLHFSTRRGWNNDPNGLVYHDGEYHLYYQHNPYGWNWGNMHWGHAVSRDLVHWEELPIAIYPRQYGDWVFSGSAVVDADNTAGFRTGSEPVIVAAYTSTGRGECIAFSNDRGRSFTDYEGNPVVVHQGRDPRLLWYEPGAHWVMAVYDERDDSQGIAFYASPDLKHWEFTSRIAGYYECPELFPIPVQGEPAQTRWILYAADGAYAIGHFDGAKFTTESGKHPFNFGNCFYASQTFSNIPPEDGRRIQIAWGTVSTPGMPFNQMMDFPVELTLRRTHQGLRLCPEPVRELALLRRTHHTLGPVTVAPGENPLAGIKAELLEIVAEFRVGAAQRCGLQIGGLPLTYDVQAATLSCLSCAAPLIPHDGRIRLHVLVDRTCLEVFANRGEVYMPVVTLCTERAGPPGVFTEGGPIHCETLDVWELSSIWTRTEGEDRCRTGDSACPLWPGPHFRPGRESGLRGR